MKSNELQPFLEKFVEYMNNNKEIDSKMIGYLNIYIMLTQEYIEEYRNSHPEFVPKANIPSDEWKYNFNICKNARGPLSGLKLEYLTAYVGLVKELLLQEEFSDSKREEQVLLLAMQFCDIPKKTLKEWTNSVYL